MSEPTVDSQNCAQTTEQTFSAFDEIPLAVFVADIDQKICYANAAFRYLASSDSLPSQSPYRIPDLEALLGIDIRNHLRAALITERTRQIDPFTYTHRTGRLYYLSISLTRVKGDYVVGVIFDITESSEANARVERHVRELRIIEEISHALHSTMRTEQILRIILAAATCKEGLGFNRAFLFLYDETKNSLIGKMAIGPSTAEEAGIIWARMSDTGRTLAEVLQCYLQNVDESDIAVNHLVRSMNVNFDHDPLFAEVFGTAQPVNINNQDRFLQACDSEALKTLGVVWCAIVPVVSRGHTMGVIVADNLITGRPIVESNVRLLQVFASHAATAIEHARLFEEVERKAQSLEAAQKTIARVQQQISAIERISLASEISHKIAHELRNPLAIIGGFAGLLKSRLNPADKLYEHAQIISDETARLESAMNDVLNFSRSFAQEKEPVELTVIARAALDVFAERHPNRVAEYTTLDPKADIIVNRDQAIQSLYDILARIDAMISPSFKLTVETTGGDVERRIKVWLDSQNGEQQESQKALVEALHSELQGSSLRMTLALETIRYNGGNSSIEIDDSGRACVYISYPVLEEQNV